MARSDNREFWQRIADFYGPYMRAVSGETYEGIVSRIRAKLTGDMSVLELACGTGQLTFPLCGAVALWEGTDLSPAMIERVKRIPHSDKVRFTVQDAVSLPYEHDSFDAVLISNALHIMPRPDKALREARRVLRPNGLLFAPTYMHGDSGSSLRRGLLKGAGLRVYHAWTAPEFTSFLEECGFSVREAVLLSDPVAPLCYAEAVKA